MEILLVLLMFCLSLYHAYERYKDDERNGFPPRPWHENGR